MVFASPVCILALKAVVAAGSSLRVMERRQSGRAFFEEHSSRCGQRGHAVLGARYTRETPPAPRVSVA